MSDRDYFLSNVKRGLQGSIVFFLISVFSHHIELRYELIFTLTCGAMIGLALGLIYYKLRLKNIFQYSLMNCLVVFICIVLSNLLASAIFSDIISIDFNTLLKIAIRTVLIVVPLTYIFNYRSSQLIKLLKKKQKEY